MDKTKKKRKKERKKNDKISALDENSYDLFS